MRSAIVISHGISAPTNPQRTPHAVKRTRLPAGSLVKMATDADVHSGRIKALIQSVGAYTWNVLSGKIHAGIRNIQYKTRLRRPFHRFAIAPRKIIFDEGASCLCFVGVEGTCIFFTRVPGIFIRVPVLYKGAWFVSFFHYCVLIWPPGHLQLHCWPSSDGCNHIRWNEWFC